MKKILNRINSWGKRHTWAKVWFTVATINFFTFVDALVIISCFCGIPFEGKGTTIWIGICIYGILSAMFYIITSYWKDQVNALIEDTIRQLSRS